MATSTRGDIRHFQALKIYDPANGVNSNGDTEISNAYAVPRIIEVDNMLTGTDCDVQARVHEDAAWITVHTFLGVTVPQASFTFDPRYNFVRVVRKTGANNFRVFAQL